MLLDHLGREEAKHSLARSLAKTHACHQGPIPVAWCVAADKWLHGVHRAAHLTTGVAEATDLTILASVLSIVSS
jgi:hypothetical protein